LGNFDEYFPFDPGFGASANATRWRKMAKLWCSDGVLANWPSGATPTASQLYATAISGNQTTIQPGAVFIHGYYAELLNPQTIIGLGTSGTIVARVDQVNEVCSIAYRDTVVDYGPTPASNYEQSANTWEIPLWLVSSGSLIDLRTLVGPSAPLAWWGAGPATTTVNPSATQQINFPSTPRLPYVGQAILRGELLVTFSDSSVAQSATCGLTYQYTLGDQQLTPTITPARPAGGPAGAPTAVPVSVSGQIPVTQGKKTVGWRVTAGPGPLLTVTALSFTLMMVSPPPIA
jgi:hypothetical protein